MKLIMDADRFVNDNWDDDQTGWIEDQKQKLKDMVDNYLSDHEFIEYKIDISDVDIDLYTSENTWDAPGDFCLNLDGNIEVDIKR